MSQINQTQPLPLDIPALTTLAPASLVSYRTQRYSGDTISVSVDDFVEQDRRTITQLYETLQRLLELLAAYKDRTVADAPDLIAFMEQSGWREVVRGMQQLGRASFEVRPDQQLRAVVHDLKGGSFLALSVRLQLLQLGLVAADDLLQLFFLTRDHLKMMRNAIRDLDSERYRRDTVRKAHDVQLLIEKWRATTYQLQQGSAAEIVMDCRYRGTISERCIEFAALDRVLYNLINNAVRFTSDGKVYLAIFPVGDDEPGNVRFVIYNRIPEEHRRRLRERFADDLSGLFQGGFTTGGSGLGMRICADFVADAYGVHVVERCLAERYLGARCVDEYFVNWFHWPASPD